MRLIDADALIVSFLDHCRTEFEIKNCCMANENVIHIVQNAPTFEDRDLFNMGYFEGKKIARRQKGEWIESDIPESALLKCSICGFDCGSMAFDFCPKCGAEMTQEADDDD